VVSSHHSQDHGTHEGGYTKDLSPVSGSRNTDTDAVVVKVAMLSTEFQNRRSEPDSALITAFANLYAGAQSRPEGCAAIDSPSEDRKSDETCQTPVISPLQDVSRPAEERSLSGLLVGCEIVNLLYGTSLTCVS